MKYFITINQRAIIENGLDQKTDITDWVIIDYLKDWFFSGGAKRKTFNEKEYVWINYAKLIEDLPLINIKSKSGITKRIKKLVDLELIEDFNINENTKYIRITEKCTEILYINNKNGQESVHSSQRSVRPSKRSVHPSKQPAFTPVNAITKNTSTTVKLDSNTKHILREILEKWNSLNLVQHKNEPPKYSTTTYPKAISNILKEGYTTEQIISSLTNYAKILNSNDHWFTYKYPSLTKFLVRGFHQFVDWNVADSNFRKTKKKQTQGIYDPDLTFDVEEYDVER